MLMFIYYKVQLLGHVFIDVISADDCKFKIGYTLACLLQSLSCFRLVFVSHSPSYHVSQSPS